VATVGIRDIARLAGFTLVAIVGMWPFLARLGPFGLDALWLVASIAMMSLTLVVAAPLVANLIRESAAARTATLARLRRLVEVTSALATSSERDTIVQAERASSARALDATQVALESLHRSVEQMSRTLAREFTKPLTIERHAEPERLYLATPPIAHEPATHDASLLAPHGRAQFTKRELRVVSQLQSASNRDWKVEFWPRLERFWFDLIATHRESGDNYLIAIRENFDSYRRPDRDTLQQQLASPDSHALGVFFVAHNREATVEFWASVYRTVRDLLSLDRVLFGHYNESDQEFSVWSRHPPFIEAEAATVVADLVDASGGFVGVVAQRSVSDARITEAYGAGASAERIAAKLQTSVDRVNETLRRLGLTRP
jgi:hypothetical protein